MSFNPADTQGNILRGYRHLHHAAYVFARFEDIDRGRALLARLVAPGGESWPKVMSAAPWGDKSNVHEALNLALTAEGVERLGWSEDFAPFAEFNEGMAARASARLHDTGESAPERWQPELLAPADMLFVLYADHENLRDERLQALLELLPANGMAEVHHQKAGKLRPEQPGVGAREQFGFRDGFSQPVVEEGGSERQVDGEGLLRWPPVLDCWRPVKLGEFLLGHLDEDHQVAGTKSAASPLYNGTFMVWRKLRQDVGAFDRYFAGFGEQSQELAAKAVGRWRDGTSLEDAPWAQPPERDDHTKPGNDFSYASDRDGARCPIGAHVRRANPRTTLNWGTVRTRRHRLIRRGMPYVDADGSRGLIFVCFNASIGRQFELVQGDWLMDGDAFGLGTEQDPLLGENGEGDMLRVPAQGARGARFLPRGGRRFVYTMGGRYLFMPGIAALRRMAEGPPSQERVPCPSAATVVVGLTTGVIYSSLRRSLHKRRRIDH
jgi:Dyp-type peroxidase family